jgi:hypothetical protein
MLIGAVFGIGMKGRPSWSEEEEEEEEEDKLTNNNSKEQSRSFRDKAVAVRLILQ